MLHQHDYTFTPAKGRRNECDNDDVAEPSLEGHFPIKGSAGCCCYCWNVRRHDSSVRCRSVGRRYVLSIGIRPKMAPPVLSATTLSCCNASPHSSEHIFATRRLYSTLLHSFYIHMNPLSYVFWFMLTSYGYLSCRPCDLHAKSILLSSLRVEHSQINYSTVLLSSLSLILKTCQYKRYAVSELQHQVRSPKPQKHMYSSRHYGRAVALNYYIMVGKGLRKGKYDSFDNFCCLFLSNIESLNVCVCPVLHNIQLYSM